MLLPFCTHNVWDVLYWGKIAKLSVAIKHDTVIYDVVLLQLDIKERFVVYALSGDSLV